MIALRSISMAIGARFKGEFATLAEARAKYLALRDESGEGASTFQSGTIKDAIFGCKLRISYNGRLWFGSTPVEL